MGAHARQLSRLRLKIVWLVKPEINGKVGHSGSTGLSCRPFRPLASVTYARYDPAVKDKHSHKIRILYGRSTPREVGDYFLVGGVVVTVKGTLVHTTCKQGVWGRAPAGYGAEPRRGAGQHPAKKIFGF